MYKWALASVLPRLIARLNLRDVPEKPNENLVLPGIIYPVIDIQEAISEYLVYKYICTANDTAWHDVVTIPLTERWQIFMTTWQKQSGDRSCSYLSFKAVAPSDTSNFYITPNVAGDDVARAYGDFKLEPGWTLQFALVGGSNSTVTWLYLLVKKESIG